MRSHLQYTTSILLALALGASLSTHPAIGYPAGAAVSHTTNPVVSGGGSINIDTGRDLLVTPADQDFILTDLVLTGRSNDTDCRASMTLSLTLGSAGTEMGDFSVGVNNRNEHPRSNHLVPVQFQSGIRVPAGGETLYASVESNTSYSCEWGEGQQISYAFSGYYAQP